MRLHSLACFVGVFCGLIALRISKDRGRGVVGCEDDLRLGHTYRVVALTKESSGMGTYFLVIVDKKKEYPDICIRVSGHHYEVGEELVFTRERIKKLVRS